MWFFVGVELVVGIVCVCFFGLCLLLFKIFMLFYGILVNFSRFKIFGIVVIDNVKKSINKDLNLFMVLNDDSLVMYF